MTSDVPQLGEKVGARVDQTLSDDLAVCLGAGMTVSDAIKYGVAALAMRIRASGVQRAALSHKESDDA